MALDPDEQRLWNIDARKPEGTSVWPLVILIFACSLLALALTIPCIGLRVSYLIHGNDKMSVWLMTCEKEGGSCVCRQGDGNIRGEPICVLNNDVTTTCRVPAADEFKR